MAHYYNRQGEPCHTIIGKNGKLRDTNVADARKLKLAPSSMGVIGQLDNYYINRWKRERLLVAAKRISEKMSVDSNGLWEKEILKVYEADIGQYSKRGTEIHNLLEYAYKTGEVEERPDIVYPVLEKIGSEFPYHVDITSELTFVSKLGYGGQVDLVLKDGNSTIIVDFKTKDNEELGRDKLYDSYCLQLASYREAVDPQARCFVLLVSASHPGVLGLHEYTKEQLDLGWKKFACLLEYWKLNNNYESGFNNE